MDLPPHEIDRLIARAASDLRREERELITQGKGGRHSVLEETRAVSSRSMWIELGERGQKDPVLAAARSWVYVLTLARVGWPARSRLAEAWHATSIEMEEPAPARISPRAARFEVLSEIAPARRRIFADALATKTSALGDAAMIAEERRLEAIRRLGDADADALEIPIDPPSSLARIAERVLEVTAEVAGPRPPRWDDAIAASLARGADEGWPARLSHRWASDLFGATGLLDGVPIAPFDLPSTLGAISFSRALASFGAAYAEADVPRAAPFVLARPPFDVRRARRSALFGSLPADPMFVTRALGLGRDRAREQARAHARALVSSLRLDAARVLLRGAALLPPRARRDRFEELTFRALGAWIPASLLFVLPSLGPEDPTRLVGALAAMADRRSLIERFDEDWFRSPHAARALREEQAALDPSPRLGEATVDAAIEELSRALEELFR